MTSATPLNVFLYGKVEKSDGVVSSGSGMVETTRISATQARTGGNRQVTSLKRLK
ncbi:MAG: hypothetical protein K0B14_08215 [Anaerolineaceae bacterium]|nr:hypothetical protein [Anaerolineaceae bacterium]